MVATDEGMQCGVEIVKYCPRCSITYYHNYYDVKVQHVPNIDDRNGNNGDEGEERCGVAILNLH